MLSDIEKSPSSVKLQVEFAHIEENISLSQYPYSCHRRVPWVNKPHTEALVSLDLTSILYISKENNKIRLVIWIPFVLRLCWNIKCLLFYFLKPSKKQYCGSNKTDVFL